MGSLPIAQSERNLFNADHGAGKGDKERGTGGWRKNYQDIDWGVVAVDMERRGVTQVKRYGVATPEPPSPCEHLYTKCGRCTECKELVAP